MAKDSLPELGIALVETTPLNLLQSLVYIGKERALAEVALNKGTVKYDGKLVKPEDKLILAKQDEAKVLEVDGNKYKVFYAKKR